MFEKLVYDYFFINLKDYSNIGIDFEINVFLFILTIALCICFFVVTIYRSSTQKLIKQLARFGCKDESTAKTLAELGLDRSGYLKMTLSHESRLTRVVGRVGEKIFTYEEYVAESKQKGGVKREKIDFSTAKFYIREDQHDTAKHILESYGTSIPRTVLYCVLFVSLYICIALVMPEILTAIDSFIGSLS